MGHAIMQWIGLHFGVNGEWNICTLVGLFPVLLAFVLIGYDFIEGLLAADLAAAPFLRGADGVMVPFRPEGGHPRGTTAWHEITVGVVARLGRHTTRTGQVVARLHQRRLVAVFGDIEALQQRLWLEARRQGILRAPQVVWRSDSARGGVASV